MTRGAPRGRRIARSWRAWATLGVAAVVACHDPGPALDEAPGEDEPAPDPDPARCAPISTATPDPGPQRLERIATRDRIPGLADQPTTHGHILGSLFAFDGRVLLGYGDYSENTGPIPMTAWDPDLGSFIAMGTLPTEEVLWFRAGDGVLYSPAIDPDGHEEDGGIYRLDCGELEWIVAPPIEGAVHVYDVAVQDAAIYASTGSLEGQPARLLRSEDHGEHWTEILRRESEPARFSRLYFLGATPELLFVSGRDYPAPSTSFGWVRRGDGDFEPVIDPPGDALVPIVLGDALVVVGFSGNPGRGSARASYRLDGPALVPDDPWPSQDGASLVAWAPQPATADEPERLLVLMATPDGRATVQRTAALEPADWEVLAELDALPDDAFVSMALLRGDLYLGTREGSLYVLRALEADPA